MRYIQITEELKQKALEEFQAKISQERFSDTRINFSFDLTNKEALTDDTKVNINITTEAWLKMWSLVHTEDGEIGWHGLVERRADKMFVITDIIMYPQFVTGVTVQTDDVGYGNWLHKEISDEDINKLRFHGHSHVNMGTSPSGVDKAWYDEILQGLPKDDFYIFAILNKKEDIFIELYDLATNTIYEKKDIKVNVLLSDNNYLQNWIERTKKKNLQEKEKSIGFQTGRLDHLVNLKEVPHFDEEDDETPIEQFILELTKSDLKDKELVNYIVEALQPKAVQTFYFGIGYIKYNALTNAEKIAIAQEYYKPSTKAKQKKYNKSKKYADMWGDYYDQYYYTRRLFSTHG